LEDLRPEDLGRSEPLLPDLGECSSGGEDNTTGDESGEGAGLDLVVTAGSSTYVLGRSVLGLSREMIWLLVECISFSVLRPATAEMTARGTAGLV